MKHCILIFFAVFVYLEALANEKEDIRFEHNLNSSTSRQRIPVDVLFKQDTLYRTPQEKTGDGWNLTWAADGSQITVVNDGEWGFPHDSPSKTRKYHSHLFRVFGDAGYELHTDIPNFILGGITGVTQMVEHPL